MVVFVYENYLRELSSLSTFIIIIVFTSYYDLFKIFLGVISHLYSIA